MKKQKRIVDTTYQEVGEFLKEVSICVLATVCTSAVMYLFFIGFTTFFFGSPFGSHSFFDRNEVSTTPPEEPQTFSIVCYWEGDEKMKSWGNLTHPLSTTGSGVLQEFDKACDDALNYDRYGTTTTPTFYPEHYERYEK